MRSNARERAAGLPLTGLLLLLAACRPPGPDLPVAERIPIDVPGAATLHVDGAGRRWLGSPGRLTLLSDTGTPSTVATAGPGVPRVLAVVGGTVIFHLADRIVAVDTSGTGTPAEAPSTGTVVLNPSGDYLFSGAANGAVLIHEPRSLEILSAWAARGGRTTALAVSPEGDRIYQALAGAEGSSTILTRDLQTGRVLGRDEFTAPFATFLSGPTSALYGVLGEPGDWMAMALLPRGGELRLLWRERASGSDGEVLMRLSPDGSRLAFVSPGAERDGLRVLDAETGETVGTIAEAPLDAAFHPRGALLLLYPGELRVVR